MQCNPRPRPSPHSQPLCHSGGCKQTTWQGRKGQPRSSDTSTTQVRARLKSRATSQRYWFAHVYLANAPWIKERTGPRPGTCRLDFLFLMQQCTEPEAVVTLTKRNNCDDGNAVTGATPTVSSFVALSTSKR